jgi:molybdopterin converting factor small subunit
MDRVRVRVELYGSFRRYSDADLAFEVPRGTTVSALRRHLGDALRRACPSFAAQGLLDASVLADASRVLDEEQLVGHGIDEVSLAVLPPVCGGSR